MYFVGRFFELSEKEVFELKHPAGTEADIEKPCLSTPAESTPESSPVKICSVKSLPGEKRLDSLPPKQYCITYFTPAKIPHH